MEYPIAKDELKNYYRSYTGQELRQDTSTLLDAITGVVNKAYAEGVQDGISRKETCGS